MSGLGHGQVWWADLDKVRPVLVLTRSTVAPLLTWVIVAPITSTKRDIPTEVVVGEAEGVADGSVANFDNLQLVPVASLLKPAGRLDDERWLDCCSAAASMMACG